VGKKRIVHEARWRDLAARENQHSISGCEVIRVAFIIFDY